MKKVYLKGEVTLAAIQILGECEDIQGAWTMLPEWVQTDIEETLDDVASGHMLVFHRSNIEHVIEEMARLRVRLKEAGLLRSD